MSFAIQNEAKEHLGFLLLSGGPEDGSCIFRSLPTDSENFETAESQHLYELQLAGEYRWQKDGVGRMCIEDSNGREIGAIKDNQLRSSQFSFSIVPLGHGT